MNLTNLAKLADKLESLPYDYRHFDMRVFIDRADGEDITRYAQFNGGLHECGAVACAVGHGPAAGITFPSPEEDPNLWYSDGETPCWSTYCNRYFVHSSEERELWDWFFSENWADLDGHHWGAAARIRFILAGNEPPVIHHGEPFRACQAGRAEVELYQEFRKQ